MGLLIKFQRAFFVFRIRAGEYSYSCKVASCGGLVHVVECEHVEKVLFLLKNVKKQIILGIVSFICLRLTMN